MPSSLRGVSSGDFKETSARLQLFHVVTRNSMGALAADAFTQLNPGIVTAGNAKSTTLAGITKVGVLGGSVAFTRAGGNNLIGGPAGGTPSAACKPVGLFLNDALGNAYENTPGVASGKGPYAHGAGSCVGVNIYETQQQTTTGGGSVGTALTWAVGDLVYASVNGLLTNRSNDSYEVLASGTSTVMGVVLAVPDATNPWLVVNLRV